MQSAHPVESNTNPTLSFAEGPKLCSKIEIIAGRSSNRETSCGKGCIAAMAMLQMLHVGCRMLHVVSRDNGSSQFGRSHDHLMSVARSHTISDARLRRHTLSMPYVILRQCLRTPVAWPEN